jgi:hypothetical protein
MARRAALWPDAPSVTGSLYPLAKAAILPLGDLATSRPNLRTAPFTIRAVARIAAWLYVAGLTAIPAAPARDLSAMSGEEITGSTATTQTSAYASSKVASDGFVQNALRLGQCVKLESYGAGPLATGAVNLAAWNAAVTALGTANGCITVGPGTYNFSAQAPITLATLQDFGFYGAGKGISVLNWASGSGGISISRNFQSKIDLRDFTMTTGVPSGGDALHISDAGTCAGGAGSSNIDNISMHGSDGSNLTDYWNHGISVTDLNLLNITKLDIFGESTGALAIGILAQGNPSSSCLSVVLNISQSWFQNLLYGFEYGNWLQGVTVSESNFQNGNYGIYVPSGLADLDQLSVSLSQFDTFVNDIEVDTNLIDVQIVGNAFAAPPGGAAIDVAACYGPWSITGNTVRNISGNNAAFGFAINCGSTDTAGIIEGNSFSSIAGALTTPIALGSSASGWTVGPQAYNGTTNTVTNAGSGNFVATTCPTGSPSSSFTTRAGIVTHC